MVSVMCVGGLDGEAAEFTASDGSRTPLEHRSAGSSSAWLVLLTCGAHMNVVRMIPPLVVTEEEINEGLTIWSEVLAAV